MSVTTKNRIKAVLAEKERSNKWLADKVGRAETTVSRWCTNKVQPTLDMLGEIAHYLDADIKDLIISKKVQTKPEKKYE